MIDKYTGFLIMLGCETSSIRAFSISRHNKRLGLLNTNAKSMQGDYNE